MPSSYTCLVCSVVCVLAITLVCVLCVRACLVCVLSVRALSVRLYLGKVCVLCVSAHAVWQGSYEGQTGSVSPINGQPAELQRAYVTYCSNSVPSLISASITGVLMPEPV